ncbi:MAG: MBL fold metallo-hydrolase [Clostridia bacterium]|nr:MBL fold metallo-hydrolase [Clostridia bacterium]
MGYKAEKEKVESKAKSIKRIALYATLGIILGVSVFSAFVPANTWKYHLGKPNISKRKAGEMRIHFLDVGQGDATLIELPDGKTALIDGGNGEQITATRILRYLNALKIDTIDHLIASHADSDHCGGLDEVLKNKKVQKAYLPKSNTAVNEEYAEFYSAVLNENCARVFSNRSIILQSTNADYPYVFSFLYPYTKDVEEDAEELADNNESSSVIWLDYQGVSALFTGDAPQETEELLIRDSKLGLFKNRGVHLESTEILKVAHHGSKLSTCTEFLSYLNVDTAIISCGKDNEYGHPTEEVLSRLRKENATIYRTDESENIVITVSKTGQRTLKTIKN